MNHPDVTARIARASAAKSGVPERVADTLTARRMAVLLDVRGASDEQHRAAS